MSQLKRQDWVSYGRWVQPPLSGCFWVDVPITHSFRKLAPQFNFSPIIFLDGHTLGVLKDREEVKSWWSILLADESNVLEILTNWEKIFTETTNTHLSVIPNQSNIFDLFKTYQEVAGLWMMAIVLGDTLEEHLISQGRDQTELMEEVYKNLRPTWLQERNRELVNLANQKNTSNFLDLVQTHVTKFSWYGTHHWSGEPYAIEKCLSEMEKLNPESDVQSSEIDFTIKLLESLTYWRTHCAEVTAKVVFSFREVLTQVAQNSNLSYQDLLLFSADEINNSLKSGQPLNFSPEIKERKNGYGCYYKEANKIIVIGEELKNLITELVNEDLQVTATIKGTVASKGPDVEVIGQVSIVIDPSAFASFKEDNILVSAETTPDFVPLMKKAKAIITDRGGITSDAAIVARELGKPCIIGTKNATQILQTGDEIKININLGTIEIINKKSL